jgi:transmembrane sensor
MVDGRRLDDMSADIDEAAARWHLAQADDDMDWAAFTDWLEADPRHRDAYDAIALLDDRIDAAGPALHPRSADPMPERRSPRWGAWSAIAAVVIAAVLGLLYQGRRAGEPTVIAYRTGPGQVRTIHLADGSRAILAPGSVLRVPASREEALTLDGSAFFDVRHDVGRPLTVQAGRYTIRDVGTRFDIAVGEGMVRVAVAEGEVAVSSRNRGDAMAVVAGRALTMQGQGRGVLRADRREHGRRMAERAAGVRRRPAGPRRRGCRAGKRNGGDGRPCRGGAPLFGDDRTRRRAKDGAISRCADRAGTAGGR